MRSAQSAHLQQKLARRRDAELIKFEKSDALHKYYDQWSRQTTKFQTWTNPEYYEEHEKEEHKRQDQVKKQEALIERRERLRQQLADEKAQFEAELKVKKRPKPKKRATSLLEDLHKKYLNTEEQRRRQELESQLYQRLRSPLTVDRDKIILESKNEHQALAKLNWLDRKIENYMKEEEEKTEAQQRQLELEKEYCKHDQVLMQLKLKTDQEIADYRQRLEQSLQDLKTFEQEADKLRAHETELRQFSSQTAHEIAQLQDYSKKRRARTFSVHNMRRVKMVLREHSEVIRKDLQQDLITLERIGRRCVDDSLTSLRTKFQEQYANELQRHTQLDALYDSEAKAEFVKLNLQWAEEAIVREQQLKCLLVDEQQAVDEQLKQCVERQKELMQRRESALSNVEFLNQLIKKLMMSTAVECSNAGGSTRSNSANASSDVELSGIMKRLSVESERGESPMVNGVPRFGRKKVAWC